MEKTIRVLTSWLQDRWGHVEQQVVSGSLQEEGIIAVCRENSKDWCVFKKLASPAV